MRSFRKLLLSATLTLLLALGAFVLYERWRTPPPPPVRVAASAPAAPSAAPTTLQDPLVPKRPVGLDATPRPVVADWVNARPGFQYSHTAAQRGGVEPCATQAVDASGFEPWAPLSKGRFSAPRELSLNAAGEFDLVIHLNGDEPIRRELIESRQGFVLYAFTLPPSQGYAPFFSDPHLYRSILSELEQALSKRLGKPARVGHVALSAWSAGFVGIEAALTQPELKDVDAVILIDGLHAPRRDRSAFVAQLKPFVDYAKRAAAGERFLFVSHSSINPPDFASTTECAHYLVAALGGQPQAVQRADALGLEMVEYFSRGNFHVRGYAGNDKADHCAQLGVLRDVYAALGSYWAKLPLTDNRRR